VRYMLPRGFLGCHVSSDSFDLTHCSVYSFFHRCCVGPLAITMGSYEQF